MASHSNDPSDAPAPPVVAPDVGTGEADGPRWREPYMPHPALRTLTTHPRTLIAAQPRPSNRVRRASSSCYSTMPLPASCQSSSWPTGTETNGATRYTCPPSPRPPSSSSTTTLLIHHHGTAYSVLREDRPLAVGARSRLGRHGRCHLGVPRAGLVLADQLEVLHHGRRGGADEDDQAVQTPQDARPGRPPLLSRSAEPTSFQLEPHRLVAPRLSLLLTRPGRVSAQFGSAGASP